MNPNASLCAFELNFPRIHFGVASWVIRYGKPCASTSVILIFPVDIYYGYAVSYSNLITFVNSNQGRTRTNSRPRHAVPGWP